ncbi:3-oxoacyl-[acyl-carrier-protein] reductase FabG [Rosistilla carotiformis]|uniref:3-oxoacyl-[acyl-carrier-protein] reductase FabG n=1 Tax=Rosistilla carotiformis TaxID=2528017 RepID=A0A518JU61_9BACT|nr:SDR family oxidoreductase [Rosistilla carotiformis]QDV69090.1 3-oxoacyl-[acyl-carrier-protein] reductase FabG [Rosistilla carotiformis]
MTNKQSKTAIVTGGSGAIGGAICQKLADDGFQVVVHYGSNEEGASAVVEQIVSRGGAAIKAAADVADPQQVCKLFETAEETFGGIDAVVVNAGTITKCPIVDMTIEQFDAMVSVNLRGSFLTAHEAAKRLRRNGRLIFISSGLAARPMAGTAVYSATKAALDAMTVSLSKELGERDITVNSVQPGATVPGMFEQSDEAAKIYAAMSPLGRLGHPDDIAEVVAFVASESGRWLTGQTVRADGGSMN